MRRCWAEEPVTFAGEFWQLERISVLPRPVQQPFPLWIGGNSEPAMRRAGRLGDGWIPSFITPERFRVGVEKIQAFAAEAGREGPADRKSTRPNSSHSQISYAVFSLKKKNTRLFPSPIYVHSPTRC